MFDELYLFRAFDVNFGELTLPDRIDYPRPQKINPFDGIHDVNSERYVSQGGIGKSIPIQLVATLLDFRDTGFFRFEFYMILKL
jgi:hypothetical protein